MQNLNKIEDYKNKDMQLLADAFFKNLLLNKDGSIGLDSKRPFGNSFIEGDIADIIGYPINSHSDDSDDEEYLVYLKDLYSSLPEFLKSKWLELNKKE